MRVQVAVRLALAVAFTVIGSPLVNSSNSCLPVIDLGYELHQALTYNETAGVYLFQNIRYAQPPTGPLRFRAPVSPKVDRDAIQNGSEIRICPQGVPLWQDKAFAPIKKYSDPRNPFTLEGWEEAISTSKSSGIHFNANSSEDCLFLDVHVPRTVLNKGMKNPNSSEGAPVLVWIHGGGYTLSSKTGVPSPVFYPEGLLAHANVSEEGMIFVALNYRLGALGFLAGPEVAADGDLNVGLLDQRLALNWIQEHIHLFGGSASRVTIMGESAGGGSVILHTTAYGGKGPTPFAQVIAQSPALVPKAQAPANVFADFLNALNISTLSEARNADSSAVIRANEVLIAAAPNTNYLFWPVMDGSFMPDTGPKLLAKGAYDKSVNILASHNSFEGSFFFDPTVQTEDEFRIWLGHLITDLQETQMDYLVDVLYPAQFDGSLGYVDQSSRQMTLWEEALFLCTFQSLNQALGGDSYAYEFSVPPGLHTQDLKYTFNDPANPVPFPQAQKRLQTTIVDFVQTGVPTLDGALAYPKWGSNQTVVNITGTDMQIARNNINETRCAWWQDI